MYTDRKYTNLGWCNPNQYRKDYRKSKKTGEINDGNGPIHEKDFEHKLPHDEITPYEDELEDVNGKKDKKSTKKKDKKKKMKKKNEKKDKKKEKEDEKKKDKLKWKFSTTKY